MNRRQRQSVYRQITILPLKEMGTLCCTTRLFTQANNLQVDVYVFSNKVNGQIPIKCKKARVLKY